MSGMRHRHLNHQDFTLAAIDDIINNGVRPSCLTGSLPGARSDATSPQPASNHFAEVPKPERLKQGADPCEFAGASSVL